MASSALKMLEASASGDPWKTAAIVLFGGGLVWLAWCDLRYQRIPNAVVYPAIVLALVFSVVRPHGDLLASVAAAFIAFCVALLIRGLSRGGLGGGDVKMAALVGAVVGIRGIVVAGIVTAIAGGIAASIILVLRRERARILIAYAPWLALGGVVALLR